MALQTSHNPLLTGERSNVPCDVVAPANGLDPVDGAGVEPHQVPGALDEAIDGHIGLVQVLQVGPPRAHQEVDVVPEREEETCGDLEILGFRYIFCRLIPYFSQKLLMTPQYGSGTANHSQSPGPMLMLTAQKLLCSWWPERQTQIGPCLLCLIHTTHLKM